MQVSRYAKACSWYKNPGMWRHVHCLDAYMYEHVHVQIYVVCTCGYTRVSVHEKEKLRGHPDDPEDRLGEYNRQ